MKSQQDLITFWILVLGGLILGALVAVFFLTAFLYVVLPVVVVSLIWTFWRSRFK